MSAFPPDAFSPPGEGFSRFLESMPDPQSLNLPARRSGRMDPRGNGSGLVRSASCSRMGVTYKEDKPRVQEAISRLVDEGIYPSPLLG